MKFSPNTVVNATMSGYTFPCLIVGYNVFVNSYECNPIHSDLTFEPLLIVKESELSPIDKGCLEPKYEVGQKVYYPQEGNAIILQQVSGIDNCSDTNNYLYLCETCDYDFDTEVKTMFLAMEKDLKSSASA